MTTESTGTGIYIDSFNVISYGRAVNGEFRELTEDEVSLFLQGSSVYEIQDGYLVDITETDEYIAEQIENKTEEVYQQIVSKYDDAINYGVFAIDETYYGNMSWYNTWSKAVNLYEASGEILSEEFTVRLYKKIDGVYYNYDTTQTLATFKAMLTVLNSKQFIYYQPIRNNLFSQLKAYNEAQNMDGINVVSESIDTAFGDIINETTTKILDGE